MNQLMENPTRRSYTLAWFQLILRLLSSLLGLSRLKKTRESRAVYNTKPKPLKGKQFPVFHAPDSKWSNPILGLCSMK